LDQQIIAEHFPAVTPKSQTLLDLGCGTGRTAIPLASRGYRVVGVDLSRFMLDEMLSKAQQGNLSERIEAVQANLVDLDCLATHCADHAICMFSTLGMIQGAVHRRRFLSHVARIVRPGGTFVVHVHHRWAALREAGGLRALASSWWRSLRNQDHEFGDSLYAYRGLDKMFMHRFSRRELRRDLTDSHWQIKSLLNVSIEATELLPGNTIAGGFIAVCKNAIKR
jgi:ubiquinone/menaquinone biosynthesis C-methylase UbiE